MFKGGQPHPMDKSLSSVYAVAAEIESRCDQSLTHLCIFEKAVLTN